MPTLSQKNYASITRAIARHWARRVSSRAPIIALLVSFLAASLPDQAAAETTFLLKRNPAVQSAIKVFKTVKNAIEDATECWSDTTGAFLSEQNAENVESIADGCLSGYRLDIAKYFLPNNRLGDLLGFLVDLGESGALADLGEIRTLGAKVKLKESYSEDTLSGRSGETSSSVENAQHASPDAVGHPIVSPDPEDNLDQVCEAKYSFRISVSGAESVFTGNASPKPSSRPACLPGSSTYYSSEGVSVTMDTMPGVFTGTVDGGRLQDGSGDFYSALGAGGGYTGELRGGTPWRGEFTDKSGKTWKIRCGSVAVEEGDVPVEISELPWCCHPPASGGYCLEYNPNPATTTNASVPTNIDPHTQLMSSEVGGRYRSPAEASVAVDSESGDCGPGRKAVKIAGCPMCVGEDELKQWEAMMSEGELRNAMQVECGKYR